MSAGREQDGNGFTFRPALQLMGGRLVGFVATFFVPIVLVRVFAPEVFGTYKQLFLIYTTLYGLAQLGMAESLFYFLPLGPEKGGRYQVNSLLVLGGSGVAALAVLWLARDAIAGWLSNPDLAPYVPWIGLYLLLMLASAGLEIALLCQRRYLAATGTYAASDVLRAAVLVAPALFVGELRWLLVGAVAFAAVRLGVHLTVLLRGYGGELRPSRSLLREQLGYSMPFQAAVLVEVAHTNLHLYAVSYWFDAAVFAVYAVGCLQIPLVELAASSAGNVLMVGMGGALKDGDREQARTIWSATTRKLALLLVPATV
ncbi:MAG TPA: oligosaccharide flippase family protein, partial [Thermoanaerobaculia bacterium]|nr:oligosaccharide flippase family protein [Thermoanaerobaculia bacterium]